MSRSNTKTISIGFFLGVFPQPGRKPPRRLFEGIWRRVKSRNLAVYDNRPAIIFLRGFEKEFFNINSDDLQIFIDVHSCHHPTRSWQSAYSKFFPTITRVNNRVAAVLSVEALWVIDKFSARLIHSLANSRSEYKGFFELPITENDELSFLLPPAIDSSLQYPEWVDSLPVASQKSIKRLHPEWAAITGRK